MQKQKGFSLLEVLITLVIISFGLLGIAGVIVNSLKNNQSSYSRTQASVLANDIIDRMRANRTTAETASLPYNLALGADEPSGDSVLCAEPSANNVVLCDLWEWRESLKHTMPSGTGSVTLDGTSKKLTIIVQWNDSRASHYRVNGDDNSTNSPTSVDGGDKATFGLSSQQIKVETRL